MGELLIVVLFFVALFTHPWITLGVLLLLSCGAKRTQTYTYTSLPCPARPLTPKLVAPRVRIPRLSTGATRLVMALAASRRPLVPYSGEADRILRSRPQGWEFRLTEAWLHPQLLGLRDEFDRLRSGSVAWPPLVLNQREFLDFAREVARHLQRLTTELRGLVETDLPHSWGPTSAPGDSHLIQYAVDRLVGICRQLLALDREARAVVTTAEMDRLRQSLWGWGEQVFRAMEDLDRQLAASLDNPSHRGERTLTLHIPSLPACAAIAREPAMWRLRSSLQTA